MIGSSDELALRAIVAFHSVAHSQIAFQTHYIPSGFQKTWLVYEHSAPWSNELIHVPLTNQLFAILPGEVAVSLYCFIFFSIGHPPPRTASGPRSRRCAGGLITLDYV